MIFYNIDPACCGDSYEAVSKRWLNRSNGKRTSDQASKIAAKCRNPEGPVCDCTSRYEQAESFCMKGTCQIVDLFSSQGRELARERFDQENPGSREKVRQSFSTADNLINAGKLDQASAIVKDTHRDPQIEGLRLFLLARIALKQKKYLEAVELNVQASQHDPSLYHLAYYNAACAAASQQNLNLTINFLNLSYEKVRAENNPEKFSRFIKLLREDQDLAFARPTKRFKKLVETAERSSPR